jgi:hypothetical protein
MAIQGGICLSYLREILKGVHSELHVYKIALFTSLASLGPGTTTYSTAGEVPEADGYIRGGQALSGFVVSLDGVVAVASWSSNPIWDPSTITARAALIYNSSLVGKNAVAILDFTADFISINGPFEVRFPASTAADGLIRLRAI